MKFIFMMIAIWLGAMMWSFQSWRMQKRSVPPATDQAANRRRHGVLLLALAGSFCYPPGVAAFAYNYVIDPVLAWLLSIVFVIVGMCLLCSRQNAMPIHPPVRMMFLLGFIFAGILAFPPFSGQVFFSAFEAGMRLRVLVSLDMPDFQQRLSHELTASADNEAQNMEYKEAFERLFPLEYQALAPNYVHLSDFVGNERCLILDRGGGHLEKIGLYIGSPQFVPQNQPRILHQWSDGVYFFAQ